MDLLKKISKNKLVIMVTHNPELAMEYSSRIINLKDGKIISDSNPYDGKKEKKGTTEVVNKDKKINMSFLTALTLSFNNLMTKKKRTILVAFAGSIGIIGIALILAVSTGFQNYVDSIQEDTLTSYPLTIMQESTDVANLLLSMRSNNKKKKNSDTVLEQQYITSMLGNVRANDLKSLKYYINKNYDIIENDISNIQYFYSVDPNIYTIDATNKLAKVNPNNLFSSMMGNNTLMSSYSMMTSIFSQMVDNKKEIEDDYQVLAGRWPESYDEVIIVLSEPGTISDLLVYSLGLRDTRELTDMISKIMSGEEIKVNNKPLTISYEDLMNVDLRLIVPTNMYKYNSKYGVYEDMSSDDSYMLNLYNNALKLKVVGVVSARDGVNSMALNPGVNYTSKLMNYIIDYANNSDIVKKQLNNKDVDVFSNKRFDSKNDVPQLDLANMISVDSDMLKSAFNINFSNQNISNNTDDYMDKIKMSLANEIKSELEQIDNDITNSFKEIADGFLDFVNGEVTPEEISDKISEYLANPEVTKKIDELSEKYNVASDIIKNAYEAVLDKMLNDNDSIDEDNQSDTDNNDKIIQIYDDIKDKLVEKYSKDIIISGISENIASVVVDGMIKTKFLEKLNEASKEMSANIANQFKIDEVKIAAAFKINLTEEELMRVISAMMNKTDLNAKTNLILLGYQDMDDPTYIAVYFNSFDGKEHFISFLDNYNEIVNDEKKINYSDTTGILMSSVKTIVNAVSYVLIAFVSISLVVSSIMIGIITYISVYERTKEIGILRSIGASKHNISSIFNAETFIIGLLSGLFGIGISYILIPIINAILHHYTGNIPLRAALNIDNALVLVVLSIILTLIGGLIPARAASKKDPVEALRSE